MNVLVTGGLGYIGSHTVVSLLESNHNVIVVDNLSNSQIEVLGKIKSITNVEEIPFFNIDLKDFTNFKKVFELHQIDSVIHFAGYKAVGESVKNPLKYYENNVISTINLLKLCELFNVYKIVFSSSATVYGDNISPMHEKLELLERANPYGETKAMCEKILMDVAKSNDKFSVNILRYFNPVGAHSSGLIGDRPNGIPNNLMPFISQVANGERTELSVFGNDYPTIDGTGVRDYIHVVDLAEGHVRAIESVKTGTNVYNLGSGIGSSVLQLIHTFEEVNKIKIPYKITNRRPGDLASYYADPTKANIELGWKCKKTLADMCKDTWNFEKSLPIKSSNYI